MVFRSDRWIVCYYSSFIKYIQALVGRYILMTKKSTTINQRQHYNSDMNDDFM